jgi:hypothetical protein
MSNQQAEHVTQMGQQRGWKTRSKVVRRLRGAVMHLVVEQVVLRKTLG